MAESILRSTFVKCKSKRNVAQVDKRCKCRCHPTKQAKKNENVRIIKRCPRSRKMILFCSFNNKLYVTHCYIRVRPLQTLKTKDDENEKKWYAYAL